MTTSHVCIDSATPFQLNETSDFMIGRDVQGSRAPLPSLTLQSLFFWRKKQGRPEKGEDADFSCCWTLKIPGKEGKNAEEKDKENRRTKTARKTKKARTGRSGFGKGPMGS